MSGPVQALRSAHRLAYGLGLALCFGTPGLVATLLLLGTVPAGTNPAEGIFLQLGYLFTGVVFLSAAWVWWRNQQALLVFRALDEVQRPARILREGLLSAAALEASSLCGLIYWSLVGGRGARHAWAFILLTPLLFLALVPRFGSWLKALDR